MLINYFKIAIAVLKRRKFFTFVSLFVISFTLAVLLVLTAFIDKIVRDDYPDRKRDRSLYITRLQELNSKNGNSSSGMSSYYFLNKYAGSLHKPVKMSISSLQRSTNTYVNNKKIVLNYKYTDADYWDVTEYEFLEGQPYSKQQVSNGEHVTVISEDAKKEYFGDIPAVTGKYLEADNVQYRVSGVVKNVPASSQFFYSDIYLPYTVSKTDYRDKSQFGNYIAVLLAETKDGVDRIQADYDQMVKKIPFDDKQYDRLYSHADTYVTAYLRTGDEQRSGVTLVFTFVAVFVLMFMLLPTLNLVNINITRIMERSSEIGVRKAFGASSKTLVYQFLVENIILTILGGLIGVLLAMAIISMINSSHLIKNIELSLNVNVLLYGLLICIFFGLLSGVYPAWRMSKLNVVSALKAQ